MSRRVRRFDCQGGCNSKHSKQGTHEYESKCYSCNSTFEDFQAQVNHICKPHKCSQCCQQFVYDFQLIMHECAEKNIPRKKTAKLFRCSCDATFKSSDLLLQHATACPKKQRYKCKVCNKGFKSDKEFCKNCRQKIENGDKKVPGRYNGLSSSLCNISTSSKRHAEQSEPDINRNGVRKGIKNRLIKSQCIRAEDIDNQPSSSGISKRSNKRRELNGTEQKETIARTENGIRSDSENSSLCESSIRLQEIEVHVRNDAITNYFNNSNIANRLKDTLQINKGVVDISVKRKRTDETDSEKSLSMNNRNKFKQKRTTKELEARSKNPSNNKTSDSLKVRSKAKQQCSSHKTSENIISVSKESSANSASNVNAKEPSIPRNFERELEISKSTLNTAPEDLSGPDRIYFKRAKEKPSVSEPVRNTVSVDLILNVLPDDGGFLIKELGDNFRCPKCRRLFKLITAGSRHYYNCSKLTGKFETALENIIFICTLCHRYHCTKHTELIKHKQSCCVNRNTNISTNISDCIQHYENTSKNHVCKKCCFSCLSLHTFNTHPCKERIGYMKMCVVGVKRLAVEDLGDLKCSTVKCSSCSAIFYDNKALEKHFETHLSENMKFAKTSFMKGKESVIKEINNFITQNAASFSSSDTVFREVLQPLSQITSAADPGNVFPDLTLEIPLPCEVRQSLKEAAQKFYEIKNLEQEKVIETLNERIGSDGDEEPFTCEAPSDTVLEMEQFKCTCKDVETNPDEDVKPCQKCLDAYMEKFLKIHNIELTEEEKKCGVKPFREREKMSRNPKKRMKVSDTTSTEIKEGTKIRKYNWLEEVSDEVMSEVIRKMRERSCPCRGNVGDFKPCEQCLDMCSKIFKKDVEKYGKREKMEKSEEKKSIEQSIKKENMVKSVKKEGMKHCDKKEQFVATYVQNTDATAAHSHKNSELHQYLNFLGAEPGSDTNNEGNNKFMELLNSLLTSPVTRSDSDELPSSLSAQNHLNEEPEQKRVNFEDFLQMVMDIDYETDVTTYFQVGSKKVFVQCTFDEDVSYCAYAVKASRKYVCAECWEVVEPASDLIKHLITDHSETSIYYILVIA